MVLLVVLWVGAVVVAVVVVVDVDGTPMLLFVGAGVAEGMLLLFMKSWCASC